MFGRTAVRLYIAIICVRMGSFEVAGLYQDCSLRLNLPSGDRDLPIEKSQ